MLVSEKSTLLLSLLLGAGLSALAPGCSSSAAKAADAGPLDSGGGGDPSDAGPANDADAGGGNGDGGATANGKFRAIAAGLRTSCVVYNDGRLYCFGGNDSGQLGDGTTKDRGGEPGTMTTLAPVDLGAGVTVTQVALGDSHVCALLSSGHVKCWGGNEQGQLGLEDNVDRGDKPGQMGANLPEVKLGAGRTALKLAAGVDFTCALLDNGSVKCWGRNANGQLGLGSTAVYVGRAPGDMGDGLAAVDLGPGRTVKDIVAGEMHACALLDDETVKCWGNNQSGQLGTGDTNARGRQAATMGANLAAIDLGTGRKAKQVFAGQAHNCALLDDGSVKCWGNNAAGQLGTGDKVARGDNPGELGDSLMKLDVGPGRSVRTMSLGDGYSCALLDNGTLSCIGKNTQGQLCLGDTAEHASVGAALPKADLGAGRTLDFFVAGPEHACGVFMDKMVRCWGVNGAGQLGLGDRNPRGVAPGQIGSGLAAAELP